MRRHHDHRDREPHRELGDLTGRVMAVHDVEVADSGVRGGEPVQVASLANIARPNEIGEGAPAGSAHLHEPQRKAELV